LIRNDSKLGQGPTLDVWCLYQTCPTGTETGTSTTCPSGTSRLGQVVLVPGCLYQTCPTGTRKGQKTPLLVPWDKPHTNAGGLSLSRDKLYTHDGACPSSTCPNLFHKEGRLQGPEIVTFVPSSRKFFGSTKKNFFETWQRSSQNSI